MANKADGFTIRKQGFDGVEGVIEMDDATLHKLQRYLLNMFLEVAEVFERNGIVYTLSGGSVLGAVRHKGFIPWDDDMDINMPRKDFEKLKSIFDRELGDKYTLVAPEYGKKHGMALSQIKAKNTVFRSYNELSQKECGICLDIFVMENVYDNAILRKLHGIRCLGTGYALSCKKVTEDYPFLKPYIEQSEALRKEFMKKVRIGRLLPFFSLDGLSLKTMKCYSQCKNDHSKYVTIPSGRHHYFREMYLREDMCETTWGEFEGQKVRLPRNYNRYLSMLYGEDFMQIPDESRREHHPFMELDFGDFEADGSGL